MESSKEENSFRWSIVQGEGEIIKSCSIDGRNAKAGTNTKRYKKRRRFVNLYAGRFRNQEKLSSK